MDLAQLAIVLVVSALDIALGVVVLQRSSRSKTHQLFALAAFSMVAWMVVNFLCDQPAFYANAVLINRLTVAAGLSLAAPLFAFAICFPRKNATLPMAWRLLLLPVPVLAFAAATTPALVQDVHLETWGTNVIQGPLFPLAVGWGVVVCISLVVALARRFRSAGPLQRVHYLYLYMGLGLFLVTTLLLGAVLPLLSGSNELAKLQPVATLLFLLPTGYAVIRHRLMDVQLVALRAASYSFLTVATGAVFVLVVEAARTEFAVRLGLDSSVLVFITGLGAVLGFQFVRKGLDRVTDRLFFRRTYNPAELLSELSKSMTSKLDQHELAAMLANDLAHGMRLTFAAVVFSRGGAPEIVDRSADFAAEDATALLGLSSDGQMIITDERELDTDGYADLADRGIRVFAPLHASDANLGAIALGPKQSGLSYSSQDLKFLEVVVAEACIAMRNAHLFDEKAQRVRELTALNELSFALGRSIELDAVLDGALEKVISVTGAESGSIMLLDDAGKVLTIAAANGIEHGIVATTRIPVGEGVAGWVAACKEPLTLQGSSDSRFVAELLRDDVASAICAPVMSKDTVIGVLNVSRTDPSDAFTTENLHVVTSVAGQLGMAIENARLYGDLENTFLGTISALAAAVDAKDPYTAGHSTEVTALAVAIAKALELSASDVQTIRIAATLHDIGKIGIDSAILLKPGRLTDAERELINRHPAIGADILAPLDFLRDMVPLVLFHHERFGGGGYPSGICGEAIPFGARIIAVADAYNAMVSDRPYREGLSLEAAMRELRACSGTQFDPVVTETFLKLLDDGEIAERQAELPTSLPAATWSTDQPIRSE